MGEMPPSAMGSSGFSRRMAWLAVITIFANIFQSGSSLKSQWERLFGSFHNMTASTMHAPLYRAGPGYRVPANSWSKRYFPSSLMTWEGAQIHVSGSGWETISRPELRNIPCIAPWLGIHQLVGSPAYFFSIKYMQGKS